LHLNQRPAVAGLSFGQLPVGGGSPHIQKTKPMEPEIPGNIVRLLSLSARAMPTLEEIFHD
jgi:hypothetical protein